jgi:hypothetical protein
MKVRVLRNLGSDLVRQLSADGIDVPEVQENAEIDLPDEHAEKLFAHGLAEAVAAKGAKGKAAEKAATAAGDNAPGGQEGTWASSTAREQQEQDAIKKQQTGDKEPQNQARTTSADVPQPAPSQNQPKAGEQPKGNNPTEQPKGGKK